MGFNHARISKFEWAIEVFEPTAKELTTNFSDCMMFMDDRNELVADAITAIPISRGGQRLSQRGEVELLVGGPPCRKFLRMCEATTKMPTALS